MPTGVRVESVSWAKSLFTERKSGRTLTASGDRLNAGSDVLTMHKRRSLCSRTGGLLAAAGIAVTAACSADNTPQKTTATTVPVPSVSAPAAFRLPTIKPAEWQRLWSTIPGSPGRRCVQVKDRTDVRSNSFIVGNFQDYIRFWDGTIENSKLYYIPLYPEQTAPPLAVSAEPLDGQPADPPVVWRGSNDCAWTPKGAFYATGTLLAHRGRWRLVATAGRNCGLLRSDAVARRSTTRDVSPAPQSRVWMPAWRPACISSPRAIFTGHRC
jgi:hypothetical protein